MIIETKQLCRVYDSYKKPEGFVNSVKGFFNRETIHKVALHPLDLKLESGKIIGLVGSNGAGKTTLLKLFSGLIFPSSGEVKIMGYTPSDRHNDYLRTISILLGQKNQLWWDIPAADSFELLTQIYGLDSVPAKKRVAELAHMLDCTQVLHVQLRRLSLGERMKMELIGALLHRPKILFLDEPTIGLDVVAQNSIRNFLQTYVTAEKPTVILTSHYMDDIALLANQLLLMSQGKIVYNGTVQDFMTRASSKKQISLFLQEPAKSDFEIGTNLMIKKGQDFFDFETDQSEVSQILQKVLLNHELKDIKIREANFEDTIREFMAPT